MNTKSIRGTPTFPKFARSIRPDNTNLLASLPKYGNSILVAGCQRSGGTMLARVFTEHPSVIDFSWSKDAELDAAQVLAGVRDPAKALTTGERYCFQTTYLNERFNEYYNHIGDFHLVWLVRNPYSVVYSMLYNWKRFALNEVYESCGAILAAEGIANKQRRFGTWMTKPVYRACYAYLGKINQSLDLVQRLSKEHLATVHYDDLVKQREQILKRLFDFAGPKASTQTDGEISTRSLKKSTGLNDKERLTVRTVCDDAYESFVAMHLSVTA